jgi:hypothetical protein
VTRADEFRDQAAACLDRAKTAVDLKVKLELLMIAVAWLDLADVAEQSPGRQEVLRHRSDGAASSGIG